MCFVVFCGVVCGVLWCLVPPFLNIQTITGFTKEFLWKMHIYCNGMVFSHYSKSNILWSWGYYLYLENHSVAEHYTLGLWVSMTQHLWPQNIWWSLWPVFHGPLNWPYILKTVWCMNIILWDYESVWHDIWPRNKCRSLWPIFHGPVILPLS